MDPRISVLLCLLLGRASAQCGPGGDKPYPPGSSTCPTKDMADQMSAHKPPGGQAPSGQAPSGGGTSGSSGSCSSPPCACSLLGDVGLTTVAGTDANTGATYPVGENIYGPFEAGFSSAQDFVLEALGCSTPSNGYLAGGIDTYTAEQMVASACGITLPRTEGNEYISLIDQCGGHTKEYHFHERMTCLYDAMASGHSTKIGQGMDGRYLYGKWESDGTLPKLDACGGHFGVTPDSNGQIVYHYHVQEAPPFAFGCYGPITESDGKKKMVTVAECRALYSGCGDGDTASVTTSAGTFQYDLWCPCYDATGSNVGTAELAVFSEAETVWKCTGDSCATSDPVSIPIAQASRRATTRSAMAVFATIFASIAMS